MKSFFLKYFYVLIIVLVSSFIFNACSEDDPLPAQEDHFAAQGMVFYDSGIKVAEIFQGVSDDTLFAPKGGLTGHIEIKFYNSSKQEINPPDPAKQSLSWEITNPAMVEVWQHSGEEGHFEFHLKGLSEGVTQIEFFVMHEGHADFRSGKITVKVLQDPNAHGEPVGLRLYDEETGTLLVTVKEDASVLGGINLASASDSTDHIEIKFFDSNNIEFQPDATEHTVNITSLNTNIAEISGRAADEPYAFKVKGKNSGNTTIKIELLHLQSVEAIFNNIPVNIP